MYLSLSVYGCLCLCTLSFCKYLSRSLSSPDDKLSENIWFVWSRTSVEINGDVTMETTNKQAQSTDTVRLSLAILPNFGFFQLFLVSFLPREPHHFDLLYLGSSLQQFPDARRQGQSESVGWKKNLTSFQIEEYREECVEATKKYGKHTVSFHSCIKLSVLSRLRSRCSEE